MLPYPTWLDELPVDERVWARIRFRMRLAALYATQTGTIEALAPLTGYTLAAMKNVLAASTRQHCSPRMALAVEAIVGRDIAPRESLAPDVYPPAVR